MTSETSSSSRVSAVQALTPSVLQEALLKDVGPEAKFKSFQVVDFCSKGDNFACYVTSIVVKYVLGGEEKRASYVVKLNQFNQQKVLEAFSVRFFEKEGRYHCELVPALNRLRKTLDLPPLKYPACFYASFEAGKEVLLLEDMRNKSFRMVDTKISLSNDHVHLVMRELAQLHASSVLLEEQMGTENFLATFNFFDEFFTSETMPPMMMDTFVGHVENGIKAAEKLGSHEEVVKRLMELVPKFFELLDTCLNTCSPKFRVVNHGDCWKNNILFRYEDGRVVEICLLDLQLNRFASIGVEFNHFFFSSVESESRKENMMDFLSTYYDSFKEVFDLVKKPMKFTLDELYEEYRRKNIYGLFMGFMAVSMLSLKTEDMPDMSELKEENASESVSTSLMKLLVALDVDPQVRSRLKGLLEEIETHRIV